MRVCVFGAGAVGSHLAVRLIKAGRAEVSLVARGPHLAAMRAHGLTLESDDGTFTVPVTATDRPADLPPQDLVIVTLKGPAIPASAAAIAELIAPSGAAAFLINGIPWWWRHGIDPAPGPLPLVDPEGATWRAVGPERAIAGIIYSPNEITAPGVVSHSGRNHYVLGLPQGGTSPALDGLLGLFADSGISAEHTDRLREAVWLKLLLNVLSSPTAALTRLSGSMRAEVPGLVALGRRIVDEVVDVAVATGSDIRALAEDHLARPARLGGKPSMLQDVEAGRPMEVESLLGQVQAFARETGVATPVIDVILPLLRGLDRAVSGPKA